MGRGRFNFTGGTIASGSAYDGLDTTQHGQLQTTAEERIVRNSYDALVMNMTRFARDALRSADSDMGGTVFTHGSNSLEDMAFVVDLLSVALAMSPKGRGCGVFVAFSDHILSDFWVNKTAPTFVDGFGVTTGGDLGTFLTSAPISSIPTAGPAEV
ncbi:hypothetical protein DL769_011708 [Monosporascus sp. CRB-8-3]|nr:hypothetical protein DL769_011708 [Monosporascus sp. CRB-8-3]